MSEQITSIIEGLRQNPVASKVLRKPTSNNAIFFDEEMAGMYDRTLDACASGNEQELLEAGGALGCERKVRISGPFWVYGPWHLANAVLAKTRGDSKEYQAHLKCAKAYIFAA